MSPCVRLSEISIFFMKTFLQILLLIFATALAVAGQSTSDRMSITGTITGIDARISQKEGDPTRTFAIKFYIQVKNTSSERLILFSPQAFFGTRTVEFLTPSGSVADKFSDDWASRWGHDLPDGYDFLDSFFGRLDLAAAPPTGLVVVEPDGYYEFQDTVVANVGYEIDETKANLQLAQLHKRFDGDVISTGILIKRSKHPYVRLTYAINAKPYKKDSELFKTLRSRWREYGWLPLNDDTYVLRSEPIINDPHIER